MACDLTKGRKEPCKDVVGGIKNVYFVDFADFTVVFDSTEKDVVQSIGCLLYTSDAADEP